MNASWKAYRDRFIQQDGRVIDWESDQRTTSEGQAYALLRAVFADDVTSFERVLDWTEANLARKQPGTDKKLIDRLWIWKWGRKSDGDWGAIDANFASDADIDACYALILAAKRWNRPEYLELARKKLQDLWQHSTIRIQGTRYLLPGPAIAFKRDDVVTFNPSYLAPYAFRLFAQVDPKNDWTALISSSYQLLEGSADLSEVGLPSDWVGLDVKTGRYVPIVAPVLSQYGFDASRVWWRVTWDAEIYNEPRAKVYLERQLSQMRTLWQKDGQIPALIDLQGNALVDYDATSQYGMLYLAFRYAAPDIAQEIYEKKLKTRYKDGFWDDNNAYYTQNLVWFGLLPPRTVAQAINGQFNLSARLGHNAAK
ncbi:glycosyl hydrolase [filamentous cyanobacterium LEGE 11480]|uniref:Glycosyl hydrolase n=2 Tax=Romeriopsis TaxID=2992131 RepID=A0A928Z353_9CYAN|nr:glycosyl hydrolase [Romeriopsis navalis LEGE 11480]